MSDSSAAATAPAASTQPDTSHFNGLQTTGREYRNLSPVAHKMTRDVDQQVPLRDGGHLLADVYRPSDEGKYPVLIAASPYPRQIQDWSRRALADRLVVLIMPLGYRCFGG